MRSDKAYANATKKDPDRIAVLRIDWTAADAGTQLAAQLADRSVAGAIHAIAGAPQENFTAPAHAVDAGVYLAAFEVTAGTLVRLVDACRPYLAPNAGIVTFGFGEFGVVAEEYGGALSVAKLALAQTVVALGVSLGRSDPPARTLEIVTGLIPTYGARGVAAGVSKRHGRRVSAAGMTEHFMATAPLAGTNADGQRDAAAELAVAFVADEMFAHTTGERIHVDGGWARTSKGVAPS